MGATPTVGLAEVFFARLESQFDVLKNAPEDVVLGGTDGMLSADNFSAMNLQITPNQNYVEIDEHIATASLEGEIETDEGGTWNLELRHRMTTNGNSTPVVTFDQFMRAGMVGTPNEVNGVSLTYSLLTPVTAAPPSLYIVKHNLKDSKYEAISGAWVENIEAEVNGQGELSVIRFSGGFATYAHLFGDPRVDGVQTSETAIELKTADQHKIRQGVVCKLGTADNGGNGFAVTAVDANGDITIHQAASAADNDVIAPVIPATSLGGTVQPSINSDLSISGQPVKFRRAKVMLQTGILPILDEVDTDRPSGILLKGPRRVTTEGEALFRNDNAQNYGDAWNGAVKSFALRLGPNTAGGRMLWTVPANRMNVVEVSTPLNEESTVTFTGKGRRDSANDDELTVATS